MHRQIFDGPANFVGSQTENGFYKYLRLKVFIYLTFFYTYVYKFLFLQKQERHFSPVTGHNLTKKINRTGSFTTQNFKVIIIQTE